MNKENNEYCLLYLSFNNLYLCHNIFIFAMISIYTRYVKFNVKCKKRQYPLDAKNEIEN